MGLETAPYQQISRIVAENGDFEILFRFFLEFWFHFFLIFYNFDCKIQAMILAFFASQNINFIFWQRHYFIFRSKKFFFNTRRQRQVTIKIFKHYCQVINLCRQSSQTIFRKKQKYFQKNDFSPKVGGYRYFIHWNLTFATKDARVHFQFDVQTICLQINAPNIYTGTFGLPMIKSNNDLFANLNHLFKLFFNILFSFFTSHFKLHPFQISPPIIQIMILLLIYYPN